MNILILGGDGFIGSHVVDKVVGLGHTVTVFDRFSYRVSKHLEHLRGKLNFVSGEFANRDVLKHVLENQDIVYHLYVRLILRQVGMIRLLRSNRI